MYPQQRLGSEGNIKEAIEVLDEAQQLGLTVMRTWAFNDGATTADGGSNWNPIQPQPGKQWCHETSSNICEAPVSSALQHPLERFMVFVPFGHNWRPLRHAKVGDYIFFNSGPASLRIDLAR
jgi:hypothetical protein